TINAVLVALVIALLEHEPFTAVLLGPWRVTALSWLGNVSAGLLAAIVWEASPVGLVLVAVPLGLLYAAYRGWLAQTVENELMEDIAHAADEITRDGDLAVRLPTGAAAPRRADGDAEPHAGADRGLVPAPAALHARRVVGAPPPGRDAPRGRRRAAG